VLPANASRVRNNIGVFTSFVRYRERCEQECSHDRRQDGRRYAENCTAGFQPAVALCFQPTHFESEITFGFLRRSSAIANGVSRMLTRPPPRWQRYAEFCTAGFQPAVALCFQPTHFESEISFGFPRCSSAIANGVSKDAHTTAAKMNGGTLKIVPLVSNRRSRCASSQRISSPK
jgi:hypothetical protein